MNEKEALVLMKKVVDKVLPDILNQSFKNFRTGVIIGITNGSIAEVQLDNGARSTGLRLPKGVTAVVGDRCVIITINTNNSSSNYIVSVY